MSVAWLNPAGGLRYHARALASAQRWAPFRGALGDWLLELEPSSPRALLVGPSAGYTFCDAFLKRFSSITLLEPDPVAAFLLTRRLRRLGVSDLAWERRDALLAPLLDGRRGLAERLSADPELCLIFGNVLGQTRFLLAEADFERFKVAFRERIWPLLGSRAWLSFHDRLSGNLAPRFAARHRAPARLDDERLLSELYAADGVAKPVELFDHDSGGFFPESIPHSYFSWQIDRQRYHLIEGVMSNRLR